MKKLYPYAVAIIVVAIVFVLNDAPFNDYTVAALGMLGFTSYAMMKVGCEE